MQVKVLAGGFEYAGQVYGSLSAVAKAVTGSHCNGFLFFGLLKGKGREVMKRTTNTPRPTVTPPSEPRAAVKLVRCAIDTRKSTEEGLELNPVEFMWSWLKWGRLAIFVPDDLAESDDWVVEYLVQLKFDPKLLRALWERSDLPFPTPRIKQPPTACDSVGGRRRGGGGLAGGDADEDQVKTD